MAVADEVEAAVGVPKTVGIDLAATGPVARGGVVAHLDRSCAGDGARELVDGAPVLAVGLVGSQTDGELSLQSLDVPGSLGWQRGCGLVQRGVEGGLDPGSIQGLQQVPAEHQRHELRRRQGQRQRLAVAVHQAPARLAVLSLGDEGDVGRLQGFEVAPDGAGVTRVVLRKGGGQFLQGRSSGALELPEQQPLARDLVIARHGIRFLGTRPPGVCQNFTDPLLVRVRWRIARPPVHPRAAANPKNPPAKGSDRV